MRFIAALLLVSASACHAEPGEVVVQMEMIDHTGPIRPVGSITIAETKYGLVFTPNLEGLTPGVHGFHVHENGTCQPAEKDGKPVPGLAAGGHYDPATTQRHGAPWGDGHLGDLPGLVVGHDGRSTYPVLAPRLKLQDIKARSLMIHEGGDNHADHPEPLGGGGPRMACGVIGE